MTRCISLLGSTGSIGRQSLEVIAACGFRVAALTANKSVATAEVQARQFKPKLLCACDEAAAADLAVRLADTSVKVLSGEESLIEAATLDEADTVLTAVVGMVGLKPTLAAIRQGKRIALANKETLVCAGDLVMSEAKRYGAEIVPVDSEHSAIFQCLQGNRDHGAIKRLILTASGGPFFGMDREALSHVTKRQALNHPNWTMGPKITVDCATMMNKGLELIEAMRLYSIPAEKISIVVHRESIIHSLVEYCDHAILAQLGAPDMRLPIQYALTWPERTAGVAEPLDLLACPPLTFAAPDLEAFPCLAAAINAARQGGTLCAALNGANEAAVSLFLRDKIRFQEISELVENALSRAKQIKEYTLEDALAADEAARIDVWRMSR